MGTAFRQWRTCVDEAVALERRELEDNVTMQRSIADGVMSTTKLMRNMNQRSSGRAFRRWHKTVLLIVDRAKQHCLHLLSMMESSANMKLRLAWRKWTCVLQLMTKRTDVTCRLIVRMYHTSLRAGFVRWRAFTIDAKGQEMTWKANGRLLVSVLRKLVGSLKLSGWLKWRSIHMQWKESQQRKVHSLTRLGNVVSHIGLQDLSMGFRSWKKFLTDSTAREEKVKKNVSTFVKVSLHSLWTVVFLKFFKCSLVCITFYSLFLSCRLCKVRVI